MPCFSRLKKNPPSPAFSESKTCFVFATNDNYAPYLAVALYSLKEHAPKDTGYDICILHSDLAEELQQGLKIFPDAHFSIRFINTTPYLDDIDTSLLVTHAHFSREAYYRFFIPHIFCHYEKVVYCDCDMLFVENAQELFAVDLQGMPMAGVLEYKFKCKVCFDTVLHDYAIHILQLNDVQKYFNSGLLIFDIEKLQALNFTEKCLEILARVQRPRTVDQCIINSLMQDKVLFLDPSWNLQTHVDVEELKAHLAENEYSAYMQALQAPKVIHYCSPQKPWNTKKIAFGELWWKYARRSGLG